MYTRLYTDHHAAGGVVAVDGDTASPLHLPLPILYGVLHTKGGSGGASYISPWTCNSIAIVRAMHVGGINKRTNDTCTKASKYNNLL